MPGPLLTSLSPAPEEAYFSAVVAALRTDPTLLGAIEGWAAHVWAWEGDASQVAGDGSGVEPTALQLPVVRATPIGYPSGWGNEGQLKGDFKIGLACYVAGANVLDYLRFAGALRSALFPTDPTRRSYVDNAFRANGAAAPVLVTSPASPFVMGPSRYGIRGQMVLSAKFYVNAR